MAGHGNMERRRAVAASAAPGLKLAGYAALFDREARIGDFSEVIRRGAFSASLAKNDILCLVDHDPARLLGRTSSGTLRLTEDEFGLHYELDLPDTQEGRDLYTLAQRGDLGGMSFGFLVRDGGDRWTGDRRELLAVDLMEISVVHSWPAYEGTTVEPRSKNSALARAKLFLETV